MKTTKIFLLVNILIISIGFSQTIENFFFKAQHAPAIGVEIQMNNTYSIRPAILFSIDDDPGMDYFVNLSIIRNFSLNEKSDYYLGSNITLNPRYSAEPFIGILGGIRKYFSEKYSIYGDIGIDGGINKVCHNTDCGNLYSGPPIEVTPIVNSGVGFSYHF